jgi:hypothetical protein
MSVYGPPPYSSGLGAGGYGPLASGYQFGPTASPAAAAAGGAAFPAMAAVQAASGAIAGYYAALSRKSELRQAALSFDFEAFTSNLNARSAESDALSVLAAGQRDVGQYTMDAGQARASVAVSQAAGGVQAGVGSAAEVMASLNLKKEIDSMTIKSNSVRQAAALRIRAQDLRNSAAMSRVSAQNARDMRRTINPYAAGAASILGASGSLSR